MEERNGQGVRMSDVAGAAGVSRQAVYHHFGSRAYVEALEPAERIALLGGISLDRVGVGDLVPIGWAGIGPPDLRDALVSAAEARSVPHLVDEPRTTSDRLSFELEGFAGARIGSTPYDAYHSSGDVPTVVDQEQLGRVIDIVWTTLNGLASG